MTTRVLRVSVDTLEVSLKGKLSKGVFEELDTLKGRAQGKETAQRFRDTSLRVEPKAFGGWRWRLTCPDFALVLSGSSSEFGVRPNAQIRLSAFGLSTRRAPELLAEARDALDAFGDYRETNVPRVDVCADLQGWMPTIEEMDGIACPAQYRAIHLAGKTPQTFQYGRGDVVLRVYNKTAELDHSGKTWMPSVWDQCEGFDPSQPVTRVEAQLRSQAIRELGFGRARDVIAEAGTIFEWVLRDWCQLRVPTGDQKVTRWPEHAVWTQLRSTAATDAPCNRARRKASMMLLDDASKRFIGLVALMAAHYGDCSWIKALELLSDMSEARMRTDGIDFDALVKEKRDRLDSDVGWGLDAPF